MVLRGLPPCSVKQCRSSCNASCAQQPSTTPSSDCKFTSLYEAGLERTRPRIAAMTSAERLGVLARTCRALTGHRRGCKAGRYSHWQHRSPKVLNFEVLRSSGGRPLARLQKTPVRPRCAVSWPVQLQQRRLTAIASLASEPATVIILLARVSK